MQVRFLGAHQCETADKRFTSILIDGRLVIDAGALTSTLTLDEQLAIENVLLTHRHWDHIKDMPGFGFNLYTSKTAGGDSRSIDVWCGDDTYEALGSCLLAPSYWLNFFSGPDSANPIFRRRAVQAGQRFRVGGYEVVAIQVCHGVLTTGYQIVDSDDRSVYYTSDNGPGAGAQWALARPDLLVTECTYSNAQRHEDDDRMHGHLCPSQVACELQTFRAVRGYLPRVAIVHVNPYYESAIRLELSRVAADMGASIVVASEGDVLTV
jgi:ribonuclease BN (tRNA processing enzyme)